MNVIDGQAGLIICASLIFYSLTIDNILNIIVLLILAGISISMLSGDNGILQKTTEAKTETEKSQEQEIVTLAYNSALAKKVGNGDSTSVTAEDLNLELTNQGASADGSNPIIVTFTSSKRQYIINSNATITYAGIKTDTTNTDLDKLRAYFVGKSYDDVWDDNDELENNDILSDADTINWSDMGAATNYIYEVIEYNGNKYTITESNSNDERTFLNVSEFTTKDVSNLKLSYKSSQYVSDTKLRFPSGATAFSLKDLSNIFEIEEFEFTSSDESILWIEYWDEDNDWMLCRPSPAEPSREESVTFTGKQSGKSISLQIEL